MPAAMNYRAHAALLCACLTVASALKAQGLIGEEAGKPANLTEASALRDQGLAGDEAVKPNLTCGCPGTLLAAIRAKSPHAPSLLRLMGQLADEPAKRYCEQCVRFLLVPTEFRDVEKMKTIARDVSKQGPYQVEVPPTLTEEIYKKGQSLEFKCGALKAKNKTEAASSSVKDKSKSWKGDARYQEFYEAICGSNPYVKDGPHFEKDCLSRNTKRPDELYSKCCEYSKFMEYYAVDRAIDYAVEAYQAPTEYLLVASGDDDFARKPLFGRTVAAAMENEKVLACDWGKKFGRRGGTHFDVLGFTDHGVAVANMEVVRRSGARFLTSVPKFEDDPEGFKRAKALLDIDFWWFHKIAKL